MVTANRHATLVQERAFPAAYGVLEYGSPRTDAYLRATAADVAAVRAALGIAEGHTAVLYAPAVRDYVTPQPRLLGLERVVLSLGPRFTVLALGAAGSPDHPRVVDVSAHPSVEELCLASDALVTDYGPLMCDFAVLDRPVVVHAEDWEAYAAARGTYLDVRAFPPGAVARSEDELIDIFTTGHWRGSRSAQLRAAFRDRFCPYDDGHAAERVVRHVFSGRTRRRCRRSCPGRSADPPRRRRRPRHVTSPSGAAAPVAGTGAAGGFPGDHGAAGTPGRGARRRRRLPPVRRAPARGVPCHAALSAATADAARSSRYPSGRGERTTTSRQYSGPTIRSRARSGRRPRAARPGPRRPGRPGRRLRAGRRGGRS